MVGLRSTRGQELCFLRIKDSLFNEMGRNLRLISPIQYILYYIVYFIHKI